MQTSRTQSMAKQSFRPRDIGPHNTAFIGQMGVDAPEGTYYRQGGDWCRVHTCRQDTFSLVAVDRHSTSADIVGYTNQEAYVKINFWLSGRHTTILDGFGQHDHDRPEVFITAGPLDMTKVDVINRNTHCLSLSLCLLRDFFRVHLGACPEELPEPLRGILMPRDLPYAFHRFALTSDLVAAARSVVTAPSAVRGNALYAQAKAIELTCLLINMMSTTSRSPGIGAAVRLRDESRLHEARELLSRRYAEAITLANISRAVGLNRMALTTGFKQLFGMSVYDCLHQVRMQHAYELLQDKAHSITEIAAAVGYGHSCNFSTAFHSYFGCTPQKARERR